MTLPPGWTTTTLGALGRYVNGRGFKKSEWGTTGRPIIRIQNLTGTSQSYNYYDGDVDERHVAHPGDLLVSWAATLGAYVWRGPEALVNQHIFRVESIIEPSFHKHLLDYKLAELMQHTHGSGMVHITKSRFNSLPVLLPPRDEQRRIVEVLEDHLSRLDAAGREAHGARRKLSALRNSLLRHVSTGAWRADPGRDGLSGAWAWRRPADLCPNGDESIAIGPFGSNLKTADYADAGVPLVFVRNVREARFTGSCVKYVSEAKASELRAHLVEPGDVVVTKMGDPPGDAAVYTGTEPAVMTADVLRLRPSSEVSAEYLALAINSPAVRRQFEQITRGVAQKKISLARFRAEVLLPVPPLEEQKASVAWHRDASAAAARLGREVERAEQRREALRAALLASAFSGRMIGSTCSTLTEGLADG